MSLYFPEGNLLKITEGGAATTMTYDSTNRLKSLTDAEGNTTSYEYATSSCGTCGGGGGVSTPSSVTDPLGNLINYTLDKNGNVVGIKDPLGNLTGMARDSAGRVTSRTDANGNITKYAYDLLGRAVKQTDSNNGATSFAYDGKGNIISLIDPNGNTTSFTYDLAGRKMKETRPMGEVTEYAYYPNGLVKTVKDAKAQVSTYTYDVANRLIDITYADGKKDTFAYDAIGNMTNYSSGGVSGTIAYDGRNRKLSEAVSFGSFSKTYSYTYDGRGNKSAYTSPESAAYAYAYNKTNRPISIAFGGKTIGLEYQWTSLVKKILPNGVTIDYRYNANSWLTGATAKNETSTLSGNLYTFDKIGNITTKETEHGDYAYNYDAIYEVTGAIGPALQETFTYDRAGNRLTDSATQTQWTYNADNELSGFDNVTYSYDNNGNTISETRNDQITKYIYNAKNRLEKVELPDGRIATYSYDPFGRRVKKEITVTNVIASNSEAISSSTGGGEITYYLYADEGLIGEYDANGNLKKSYGWLPDGTWGTDPIFMYENGSYYFYHNDHLGTPQKMTDESGNVVWSAKYSAFGKAVVDEDPDADGITVSNNLRFPGQYFDEETGKHYNWNRYYDPTSGRYTQVDPIGFRGGDENLYGYVGGNPVNFNDPYGLRSISDLIKRLAERMLPKKIARAVDPMSPEEIIKELADKEKERIKAESGPDDPRIKKLEDLKKAMDDEGLHSELDLLKEFLKDNERDFCPSRHPLPDLRGWY